jgi:hypothetical protein
MILVCVREFPHRYENHNYIQSIPRLTATFPKVRQRIPSYSGTYSDLSPYNCGSDCMTTLCGCSATLEDLVVYGRSNPNILGSNITGINVF